MKNGHRVVLIAAVAMLLSSGMMTARQVQISRAQKTCAVLASQIDGLLPARTSGSTADHSDAQMPVLEIGGTDYVCLLEVPALSVKLPVANHWQSDALKDCPARFWGSIYDGSCILGGSSRTGQFDFCARLEIGDAVTVTDMRGTEFRCQVERIDRTGSAAFEQLSDENYPLTLFVREEYDARYIVVRCGWDH